MLKILFFGDVMGKIGRRALAKVLPELKKEYDPDLTALNIENSAHGKGTNPSILEEMSKIGVDFFTAGNHIWNKKEIFDVFSDVSLSKKIIRPANYPDAVPGKGFEVVQIGTKKILMINLLGRVFIKENTDCPFRKLDEILKKYEKQKLAGIIVDFHAEATSEKKAFGFYADGRISAVIGTHTHVATSDQRVLPGGTAYISDAGMVGAKESVIGVDKGNIIKNFLTQLPQEHLIPESGACIINGVIIEIDPKNKKAVKIERVDREVEIS